MSVSNIVQPTCMDPNLAVKDDDPRVRNGRKHTRIKGAGRNTESFDPRDSLVRPDMRIIVEQPTKVMNHELRHDDVVIVPDFFCNRDDWSIYYKLIEEMREIQEAKGPNDNSKWISWAEGAHLISKEPSGSATFDKLQKRIVEYLNIKEGSYSTRFNWYRDSSDWKPYHHDSAAFNPERARKQNITVGISFGATRELGFINATSKQKIYFPQTNGMLFTFGRDVNIRWKHGVNALHEKDQDGKGRISIILWGLTKVIEEEGSPPILNDNTRGNGYNMHKGPDNRDFRVKGAKGNDRRAHRPPFRDNRDFDHDRDRERLRDRNRERFRSRSRSRGRDRDYRFNNRENYRDEGDGRGGNGGVDRR